MQLLIAAYKSSIMRALNFSESTMSQVDDIKASAQQIRKGLRKLGPDRVVALSTHKEKELIVELEKQTDKLLEQLESLS